MDSKKTILVVAAALAVGLIAGLLGPKMFNRGPSGTSVVPLGAPGQQAPAVDYTLQINELKRVLDKNPNDVGTLIQLGNTYFDSNMAPESIQAYERALALKPGNPDVLTDLGVMYRRDGKPEQAVARFREAMKYSGTHQQSRFNLGVVLLYDLRDIPAAKTAFQDYLKIVPTGPQADSVRQLLASIEEPPK